MSLCLGGRFFHSFLFSIDFLPILLQYLVLTTAPAVPNRQLLPSVSHPSFSCLSFILSVPGSASTRRQSPFVQLTYDSLQSLSSPLLSPFPPLPSSFLSPRVSLPLSSYPFLSFWVCIRCTAGPTQKGPRARGEKHGRETRKRSTKTKGDRDR